MRRLMGHHNNPQDLYPKVDFEIIENALRVKAEFQGDLNINKDFSLAGFDNWNLWDFDVFEMFLTKNPEKVPYLEVQCSPIGQKFALLVSRPRKDFKRVDPQSFEVETQVMGNTWLLESKIDLDEVPGEGHELFGDFHFCLGTPEQRQYYGLNINKDEKADFHRPDLFIKLGELP